MQFCGMMILTLVISVPVGAAVMGDTDLLGGVGNFDTTAQQDAWTLSTYDDDSEARFTTTYYTTPYNGVELFAAGSGGGNFGDWAQAHTTFATVANRAHRVTLDAQMPSLNTCNFYAKVDGESTKLTVKNDPFARYDVTPVSIDYAAKAGSGAADYLLELQTQLSSARTGTTGLWIDTVRVYRELAAPQVSSQSLSSLDASQTANVTLGNAGGTTAGDMLIAFDPDATVTWVSGAAATVNSFIWNSDNELVANITAGSQGGDAVFAVTNPYGGQSAEFIVNVVPEPVTLTAVLLGAAGLIRRRK